MDNQVKSGWDGVQGVATPEYAAKAPVSNPMRILGFILRVKAVVLTLVATIVMGVASQSATINVADPSTGDVQVLDGTAKSTYSAAFVYFIVANVIVFVYSCFSLALSMANQASSNKLELPFSIGDLMMVVLLFSSNGAATAISIVAEMGNSHLGWSKICDVVGTFCAHVTASIVLSMVASLAYVLLLILSIVGLHKRSP